MRPCSAGPRLRSRTCSSRCEHLLHLLLGVGVGDLEVAEVVEQPADLLFEAVVAVAHPAADLALDHPGVVRGRRAASRAGGRSCSSVRVGLVDGGDRLLLHGEDPRDLLAELAAGVVELAGGVFLGDDPQPDLAALAQVRALDRVEVAGVGVERDDRAAGELQRREVPVVVDLLVLASSDGLEPVAGPSPDGADQSGMATASWGSESPVATL